MSMIGGRSSPCCGPAPHPARTSSTNEPAKQLQCGSSCGPAFLAAQDSARMLPEGALTQITRREDGPNWAARLASVHEPLHRAFSGRLGRRPRPVTEDDLARTVTLSLRDAASVLAVPRSVVHRVRSSARCSTTQLKVSRRQGRCTSRRATESPYRQLANATE